MKKLTAALFAALLAATTLSAFAADEAKPADAAKAPVKAKKHHRKDQAHKSEQPAPAKQ